MQDFGIVKLHEIFDIGAATFAQLDGIVVKDLAEFGMLWEMLLINFNNCLRKFVLTLSLYGELKYLIFLFLFFPLLCWLFKFRVTSKFLSSRAFL